MLYMVDPAGHANVWAKEENARCFWTMVPSGRWPVAHLKWQEHIMCAILIYTMYNCITICTTIKCYAILIYVVWYSNIAMCSVCTFIVVKQSWLSQFPNSGCHQGIATFEPIPKCQAQRNIGTSMPHLVSKWSFKSSSLQVLAISVKSQAAAGNTRSGRPSTSSMVSSSETSAIQVISRVQTFCRRRFLQRTLSRCSTEKTLARPDTGRTRQSQGNHPSASENSM